MKHLVWAALLSAALHAAVLAWAPELKHEPPALSGSQAPVVVSLAHRAAPGRESRPEKTAAPRQKEDTKALPPPSRTKPEPPKPKPVVKKPAPKKAPPPKPEAPAERKRKAVKKKAVSRPVAAAPAAAAPPETPPPVPKAETQTVAAPQNAPAAATQQPAAGPAAPAPAGKSAPARDGIQSRLPDSGKSILKPAAPLYRRNPPPRYPRIAKSRGYQGKVLLKVLVGRHGRVLDIAVAASSGYRVLDKAALKAVADWLFEPGKKGEKTVEMWVKVPIRFEIK